MPKYDGYGESWEDFFQGGYYGGHRYGEKRHRAYGPHGLWYDPAQNRDKHSNPYNYDSFFIFGDHESIKGHGAADTDRMSGWDHDKWVKACEAMDRGRWEYQSKASVDRFVAIYLGEQYECCGLVEWCNQATGYPGWSVYYKEKK